LGSAFSHVDPLGDFVVIEFSLPRTSKRSMSTEMAVFRIWPVLAHSMAQKGP
jgi:hypothetical protein